MKIDRIKQYLLGRAGRREYWTWIVLTLLASIALNMVIRDDTVTSLIGGLPWFIIATRRLRDFGASVWWSLFPFTSGFVVGFLFAIINAAVAHDHGDPPLSLALRLLLTGLLTWGFIFYVGVRRSRPPTVELSPQT